MTYKPRSKRLQADKVRAKLIAQQVKLAKPYVPQKMQRAAMQVLSETALNVLAKIQPGVQAEAEIDSSYRPLFGRDAKETVKLLCECCRALPQENQREFMRRVLQHTDLSGEDLLSLFGLALVASHGNFEQKPETLLA